MAMQRPAAGRRRSYVEIDLNERCILLRITREEPYDRRQARVLRRLSERLANGPRCRPKTWR
jgi:hypothetical protein